MLLFPVQLLAVAVTVYLELVRSAQGGAYYGIKQLPPQVPQYQPLGQQVPHMPLGKEGIPMQHLGKEVPHMPYGKEYPHLPQYRKEVPQMPMLGKDMAPKKEKGRSARPSPLLQGPVCSARALFAMGKWNTGAGCCCRLGTASLCPKDWAGSHLATGGQNRSMGAVGQLRVTSIRPQPPSGLQHSL